jgi:hypothetical protein
MTPPGPWKDSRHGGEDIRIGPYLPIVPGWPRHLANVSQGDSGKRAY